MDHFDRINGVQSGVFMAFRAIKRGRGGREGTPRLYEPTLS